jgi:tRNA pseudouridine13 synthase
MNLPYITQGTGIGGKIKEKAEFFRVIEIPVYEPEGKGNHLFINFTKKNLSTNQAMEAIAKKLNINPKTMGAAGLKDKLAETTQTVSVELSNPASEMVNEILDGLKQTDLKINWARLHTNKLKPGHLIGNKFIIKITGIENLDEAFLVSQKIAEEIQKKGVPNFYGEQRFGGRQDNVEQAKQLLAGKINIRDRWLKRFLMSSYQSHLFNQYLSKRIENGLFSKLINGDICKKLDTGGLFVAEGREQERLDKHEITFTGPMFGERLWFAEKEAGEFEKQIIRDSGLSEEQIKKLGTGLRRPGTVFISDMNIKKEEDGLVLSFTLPKGSFATVVLREFMKNERTESI